MRTFVLLALTLAACSAPPVDPPPPPGDSGVADGGHDAGELDAGETDSGMVTDDGGAPDGGPLEPFDGGRWTWVPVAGSQCGSGATAGLGLNRGPSTDELLIFVQGGGACWNSGTCVPSFSQFGPLCDYGNLCLVDNVGGTQPTAVHVREADPYPADGGGAFPGDLAQLGPSLAFSRAAVANPFRRASFVYVPYCTGDVHSGAVDRQLPYQPTAFGPINQYTMHFRGATNMDAYLAYLKTQYPDLKRIWLTGASGGAFGASMNFDRVQRAFPNAEVHLLSDSGPMMANAHWTEWRDLWSMQMPVGCTTCDAGFPQVMEHLATTYPTRRMALLSYEEDGVISWFFYAPPGLNNFLNPPYAVFASNLGLLETRYDAHPNTRYFVVPGNKHVLFGDYGVVLSDGGVTPPISSRDGGTDLRRWLDAWALGDDAGWQSQR